MDAFLHSAVRTASSLGVLVALLTWESFTPFFAFFGGAGERTRHASRNLALGLINAVVQLHHANVALPARLDRALRVVIVTPFMHKVHHSRWQPETDSNYSSLFSFRDRLFGSFGSGLL